MSKKVLFGFLLFTCMLFFLNQSLTTHSQKVIISELEGRVTLQRDIPWWRFWDYEILADGDFLQEGDRVRTGSRGSIRMEFPCQTLVTVGPGSLFEIHSTSEDGSRLYMRRGSLGARIIHIIEGLTTFEVETPSSIAAVRGTEFKMHVDYKRTVLIVSSGNVYHISANVEVLVPAGKMSIAEKNKPPETTKDIPDEIKEKIPDLPGPPDHPPKGKPD